MRISQLLTTRKPAGDNEHDLLARAGYTHRLDDGLYTLLPLGHRVLQRINAIVRSEITRVGGQEVTMPLLQPEKLWQYVLGAGPTRAAAFGTELFRLVDEYEQRMVLAPTHEETAAIIGAACIREARDVPRIVYQIQPRFRHQFCPVEGGLLRTREFVMADVYSFHADRRSLDEGYAAIKDAFRSAVALCGVRADVVVADAGAMGGEESEEFIARLPNVAATAAVQCSKCGYAASVEIAEFARTSLDEEMSRPVEEIAVPDAFSVQAVTAWLGAPPAKFLASVPFLAGGRVLLAVIPGDLFLNFVKLVRTLSRAGIDTADFHAASAEELNQLGGSYDWISLVRTPRSVVVIADEAVRTRANFVMRSPRLGHFLTNLNSGRDFNVDMFADLATATEGAGCPKCENALTAIGGTEIGHIFKLGARYTAAFGAQIEHAGGAIQAIEMGSYGLGITRLMATVVEQNRDARGIIWPEHVAPYSAIIVPLRAGSKPAADQLYRELTAAGLDVLFDDTGAPSDEKLRNADLLGIPLKIVFSGDWKDAADIVEIQKRASAEAHRVPAAAANALLRDRGGGRI